MLYMLDQADYFNLLNRIEDLEKEALLRESSSKRLNFVSAGGGILEDTV